MRSSRQDIGWRSVWLNMQAATLGLGTAWPDWYTMGSSSSSSSLHHKSAAFFGAMPTAAACRSGAAGGMSAGTQQQLRQWQ